MTMPLLSVIVPLYNHERFIERCLDSVLEDPYPNKELVIIDDGSRDASAEVVRNWQNRHSNDLDGGITFVSRENRGLTRTLNELIGLAGGEYIALLASDDYLLPSGMTARVRYLERHADKLAVFGDCLLVDYEGNQSEMSGLADLHGGRKKFLADPRLLSYELVINWCVPGPVFMARSELFSRIGGYNENIAVEDWDFYLRATAQNLIGYIDQPVAVYRIRNGGAPGNATVEQDIRFNEAMLETAKSHAGSFPGIRGTYLYFERLKYYGILERLRGRASVKAFLARKVGRVMVSLLKVCYGAWATLIASPAVQGDAEH